MSYPDNNPKTAIGVSKAPYHLVPPAAIHHTAMAFADGANKYGPYNWRDKTVSSSVYYAAALRHLTAWWDGEDLSQDAKVHHLGHVMACMAILLDAESVGKMNDDRPTKGAVAELQSAYANKEKDIEYAKEPIGWPDCDCEEQGGDYQVPPWVKHVPFTVETKKFLDDCIPAPIAP